MTKTMEITEGRIETVETKKEYGVSQVCFGAVMAVATLYGMWGTVSLLISYFAA